MSKASSLAAHVSSRSTPQTQPIPGKPMVANSAGGFTFAVDCFMRLQRFLILGSEGGTFYADERKVTVDSAGAVLECAKVDPDRTVKMIRDISVEGRAPKNQPAIFALALLAAQGGDIAARALAIVSDVCRIGTHLFDFVRTIDELRGWPRSVRRAVADWYADDADRVAYDLVKYQQRDGMSHRDVLRLSHPKPATPEMAAAFAWAAQHPNDAKPPEGWVVRRPVELAKCPAIIQAFEEIKRVTKPKDAARLIAKHNLPRECVPTELLNDASVWEALLEKMPITAMVRNLGKMTAVGLLKPLSSASKLVCERLRDTKCHGKPPLHPMAFLIASRVYAIGRGVKGSLTWSPDPAITAALDDAFYLSFGNVVPTGKRFMVGLDISGSMGSSVNGSVLSCREAGAALAMLALRTEPQTYVHGFGSGFVDLQLNAKMDLAAVVRKISGLPFATTNCAVPMLHATQNKLDVDVFVVITDNETYAGHIHPSQALQEYRKKTGIPAKLAVWGMATNEFSIADPSDAGMLDIVGFDTAAPEVLADFARG